MQPAKKQDIYLGRGMSLVMWALFDGEFIDLHFRLRIKKRVAKILKNKLKNFERTNPSLRLGGVGGNKEISTLDILQAVASVTIADQNFIAEIVDNAYRRAVRDTALKLFKEQNV